MLTCSKMLMLVPISFRAANAFISQHHRHHRPSLGHIFSLAVSDGERIVAVATIGRPVSRILDDGWTVEVNRLASDGGRNACSMLYAAAWRTARAMGYRKIITYILQTEPGTSLAAAGWRCTALVRGRSWDTPSRPRMSQHPVGNKLRYEIGLSTITLPRLPTRSSFACQCPAGADPLLPIRQLAIPFQDDS
jgi:hypothetical protein